MPERIVSVVLKAQVDGLVSGMRKAKASVDDLTKAATPTKADAFSKLADKAALAGVGVATGLGLAIKRFADFDQAMSAVKANTGATGAEFDNLRDLAIKLGADSQFSAKEAAEGINEMGKAGVKTRDIMGGGLKGALDLAAAGQISVADAAETAATAMTQFKLSGDKVPHIADLLANASNKAQGGVGDMAQALKQAGLVAASTGLSIEETTAGLTAFASAGLIGSDAGTSFKTMLQRLSAPTDEAKAKMNELGISAFDSQGNFIGLATVAEQLKVGLGRLTPEQRAAAEATIFGSDAIRAANVLYEQGGVGIQKWTKEVSEQGAAAKQAATLTDNLNGDIERLGGALDSVFIKTGSGANGGLRTLVQGLTDFVGAVGEIPGPVLLAGGALTSFALLAPKGVLKYREYKANLDAVGLSFEKISAKAPRTGAALEKAAGVAKRTGLAFAAAAVTAGALDQAFGKDGSGLGVQSLTKDLLASDDAVKAFSGRVEKYAKSQSNWWNTDEVRSYGDVLKAAFDPSVGQSMDKVAGSLAHVSTDVSNAKERLGELDQVLAGLVSSGQQDKANQLFGQFAAAAKDSGISVDQLKSKLPGYTEAFAGAANAATTASVPTAELSTDTDALSESADKAAQAQIDLKQAIVDAANAMLAASNSDVALAQANVDLAKTADDLRAKTTKGKAAFDLSAKSGRDAQSALNDYAATARQAAEDNLKAGDSTAKVNAAMQTARKTFVDNAVKMGLSAAAANQMANKFGLSTSGVNALKGSLDKLPSEKAVNVTVTTKGLTALQKAGDYLKDLHDKHVTLTVGTVKVGSTKVNAGQFSSGGYTGDGGMYEPAGIVHRGEYVITKAATDSIGKATLAYLNQYGRLPGYASGGEVTGRMVPQALAPVRVSVATPKGGNTYAPSFTVQGADAYGAVQQAMREFEYRVVNDL